MRLGFAVALAGLVGATLASQAHASCDGSRAPTPSGFAGPLGKRFDSLHALDQEIDPNGKAKQWQALLDDAERASGTPPALLVRSYAGLAWAQGGSDAEPSVALASARKGMDLARKSGLDSSSDAVELITVLSIDESSVGDLDSAAADAARAEALARRKGEVSIEYAGARLAQAFVDYSNGRFLDAEREYADVVRLEQRCLAPENSRTVSHMASHAAVMDSIGLQEEALAENERGAAWAMAHLPPDSTATTLALNNLGVSLRNVNRLSEAEAVLREVLDREAKYEPELWSSRATALSNFATLIEQQGRHAEAERLWLQSLDWRRKASSAADPVSESQTLRFVADAAENRGEDATALARRQGAVDVMHKAGLSDDHPELARARVSLAYSIARTGRTADALKLARPAIAVIRAKMDAGSVRRMGTEMTYARIVGLADGPAAGLAEAEPTATALKAKLFDTLSSKTDLIRYGPLASSAFGIVADYALQVGRDDEAVRALQMTNLSEIVVAGRLAATRAASADPRARTLVRTLQDKVRERQRLDRQRSFLTSAGQQAKATQAEAAIKAADQEITGVAAELDRVFPDYHRLSRPEPQTLEALQARLQPGQVLLAPLALDDGTLAVAVSREGLAWKKTAVARPEIERLVGRVRASIDSFRSDSAAPFDVEAASRLYLALAPPALAPVLRAHPSLLYYAGGALGALPASLLVEPHRADDHGPSWLIRSHDIAVVTSLDTPAASQQSLLPRFLGVGAPSLATTRLASAGGLDFRGGRVVSGDLTKLPALPGAASELVRLKAVLGGREDTLLLGKRATEAAVKALPLESYSIITFATHGVASGEYGGPSEPALVLTPPATPSRDDDGLLTVSEIAGLRLKADWVVLSACDSGGAAETGAATYSGLASAFREAGARALLVSLWPVRDDAAEALTVATIRNFRGGASRPQALQRAILAMIDDPRLPGAANPALWAPFVLVD